MYILIGMIASGKSTLTKSLAADGALVVNDDSITVSIHGGDYLQYDSNLKPLYREIEHLIILSAKTNNRDVVIDKTNLTKKSRARYINWGKEQGFNIVGVVFPGFKDVGRHAMHRFLSGSRGISLQKWTEIAVHHASIYEPPTADEFDRLANYEDFVTNKQATLKIA